MSENQSFPTLSQAATAEIMGDNLCFVIAYGADGKVVQYFPHGVNIDPSRVPNGDPMKMIDTKFNIADPDIANSTDSDAMKLMRAIYWCKRGGVWVTCPSPC